MAIEWVVVGQAVAWRHGSDNNDKILLSYPLRVSVNTMFRSRENVGIVPLRHVPLTHRVVASRHSAARK